MEEIEFVYNGSTYIVGELKVPNSTMTYGVGCIFEVFKDIDGDNMVFINYFYGISNTTSREKIIELAKTFIR